MRRSRVILRDYYDAAAPNYLERASKGVMGWLRRRELAVTLDMIPAQGHGRALDAGCGPGYYSQVLRDRGFDVTAVDLSPRMVDKVRALGIPAYEMDIEHSEPPEELAVPFDFILCAGVLEFAEEAHRFLGSLRSLGTNGSQMLLVAPSSGLFGTFYKAFLSARGIPGRLYAEEPLVADLRAAGFKPLEARVVWPICLAIRAQAVG